MVIGDSTFISKISMSDVYRNPEALKTLVAALKGSRVHLSPSEFTLNLDYTEVLITVFLAVNIFVIYR